MKKLLVALLFGYACFQFAMYAMHRWSYIFLVEPDKSQVVETIETTLLPRAVVNRVVDGDTLVLDDGREVRLIGVDAPELYPEEQCYGPESKAGLKAWLEGKTVSLEKDVSEVDQYDRLLRYVWVEDSMVNEEIVRRGWARARAYEPDTSHETRLFLAQTIAQTGGLGMWDEEGCNY